MSVLMNGYKVNVIITEDSDKQDGRVVRLYMLWNYFNRMRKIPSQYAFHNYYLCSLLTWLSLIVLSKNFSIDSVGRVDKLIKSKNQKWDLKKKKLVLNFVL